MIWKNCKLGDVLTLQRGFDLPTVKRSEGTVPVVSSSGVTGFHSEAKVAAPGVVIGRYGTLGEVHFVQTAFWPLNTSLYVKDFKGNDPRFCAYLLKTISVTGTSTAAAVPGVNRNVLHELPSRQPPLSVQRRISSILGAYDDLIEVNRRRIAVLEEMARRLFDEWFVRLRFPGSATATLTDHEHGPLPDGWTWLELQQLCVEQNGIQTGPFGSQLHQADYTDFGVPVVMPKNLVDLRVQQHGIARIPEALADSLSRHRLQPGDIVYGRRGDIGRRAFVSEREKGWFCGTGCLRLRPDPAKIAPRYLFAALGLPVTEGMIRGRAQGVTMPNLSAGVMASISVLCPPGSLQSSFARFVGGVSDLISALHVSTEGLSASLDLLLPRLISGDLSVAAAEQELADAA